MPQGVLNNLAYESGPRPVAAQQRCSLEARLFEGTVIADRYRIETLIAEGGMGLVFRGRHLILDQPIALKIIRPAFAHHHVAVARFLDEARAIARLKSPHVAHVFDSGTVEDGTPYMVLELLSGSDLRSVLDREGPLSFECAANYVMQACRAVSEAHSLGIVHRDLKPENLFLHAGSDGLPMIKVLDFGISKRLNRGDGRSYTIEGETLGSPHYMAPEQMSAGDLDERADIWALGVVLFELVTGRVPFRGDNIAQVCTALLSEEAPPVSSLRREVPYRFEEIVSRCLRKDPSARYSHVDELAEALRAFSSGASSAPPGRSTRNALDSEAPTLLSLAPPGDPKHAEIARRGEGRPPGLLFQGLTAIFAASLTVGALFGLRNLVPASATAAIPVPAAALLTGQQSVESNAPAPDGFPHTEPAPSAIEKTIFEAQQPEPVSSPSTVEPSLDDTKPRPLVRPVGGPANALRVKPPVNPGVGPQRLDPDAPAPASPPLKSSLEEVGAPVLNPPSARESSPQGAPESVAPDTRPEIVAPPKELDELIPPYQAPPRGSSGAEPNDSEGDRYF